DRVSVLVGTSSDTTLDGDAIRNTGDVQAALVTMKATGSAYSTAVNNAGIIRAQGSETVNGRVLLTGGATGTVYNSGTITAADADGTGGHVEITGDRVALTGNALVDVSGDNGGGTALIGGSFQGKADASVQNASRTFIGADAQIKADARESGNGGQVVVWADGDTTFLGNISAQGGVNGGAGGNAEVSGKEHLVYRGFTDLRAADGSRGTLLLDPKNITIDAVGGDAIATNDTFAENPAADATFLNTDLVAALDGANLALQANNDITVAAAIDASGNVSGGSLSLEAGRSIAIQDNITVRGSFSATANSTAADAANRDAGDAQITLDATRTINTTAANGNISLVIQDGATGGDSAGAIILNGELNAGAGDILLDTSTATVGDRGINIADAITADNLTISSAGTITQAAAGGINVDVLTSLSAAGAISLNSVSNDFTNVTVGSGTDVTLADINDIALDAITTTGNLTVATANGVLTTSASAINVGAGSVSLTAGSSGNDNLLTVGAGGITGAGGVTLVADNMDIIGTIDSGAPISA